MKKYLLLCILTVILFLHCAPEKRLNVIGILYKQSNEYCDNEITKMLSQTAFENNYSVIIKTYQGIPAKKHIREFNQKQVKIIILEAYDLKNIKSIYNYCKANNILLALITTQETDKTHLLYITDFKKLGKEIANQLYNFTRRKRNTFIIYFKDDYIRDYYKTQLLLGFNEFFGSRFRIYTNHYINTEPEAINKDISAFLTVHTNNLRGILTDEDRIGSEIVEILKRRGKDGEVKVSAYNADKEGINSIVKFGLCVTAGIDRYSLFQTSLTNTINHYDTLIKKDKPEHIFFEGVYYNPLNVLENLARTRKFSIHQIINKK